MPTLAVILCSDCLEAFIVDLEEHFSVPILIENATKVGLKLRKGDFVCDSCAAKAGRVRV